MLLCYVDESGNDQVLNTPDAPPVLALAGLVVAERSVKHLVWEFLKLKKAFNPQCGRGELSELIRTEVKGANLRADIRSDSRRRRRAATGFIDATLRLLDESNATLIGYVWVKSDGQTLPRHHYADGVAAMAQDFHSQLAAAGTAGMMILDARTKVKNTPIAHGITTRRFKSGGDPMPHLAESPVFGHSDSHVILQIADIVASSLLFPMACRAYCGGLAGNVHNHERYDLIRERWGDSLRALEHRYTDATGAKRGGLVVRDSRNHGSSVEIFGEKYRPRERVDLPASERERRPRKRTRAGVEVAVVTQEIVVEEI